ncbi:hypothetical protein PR002_g7064 [Phytophthora rubi]|uniref:Uncharacterized protein n=1 Tax=Phytophthora rubi TaxID=129364 RepID=A0A6A3N4C7_9STRA|nr:hypothetical protein PR002_g7064 [Phytophthora rubi]
MIGADTGGSSCVSQEHYRTCTATEKMQATTADAGSSTTMASSGNTATTTDANTSNGSDNGKRGHTRAAGSTTVESDGSRAEAIGLVRLVGR